MLLFCVLRYGHSITEIPHHICHTDRCTRCPERRRRVASTRRRSEFSAPIRSKTVSSRSTPFFALEDVYTVTDQEEPIYPPDAVPLFPTTIAAVAVRFPAKASRLRLNSRLGSRHPAKKRSTARPRHNIHHSYSDYRGPPSLQSTPVKARRHYLCVRWVEAGAKLKVSSYLVHVLRAHATSLITEPPRSQPIRRATTSVSMRLLQSILWPPEQTGMPIHA